MHSLAVSLAVQRRHKTWLCLNPLGWLDWYSQLFSATIGIDILGAGFTFSVIFNDFNSSPEDQHVRACSKAS
jgi:hypothetical protein